ncbi:unnamed protein product, partial [Iphiclides podalirius]
MAAKLHFFDFGGIAEPIRYLLHYGGKKFEDIKYDIKTWPDKKTKDLLPYGQLPMYEEGGLKLTQSLAIARYVAYKVNVLPTDPWEQAMLDSMALTIYDFWSKIVEFTKEQDPAKKETIKEEIIDETIDYYFSRFDKQLMKNKGYINGKLSWVDFVLVGIVEAANLIIGVDMQKQYPNVDYLMKTIVSLPGVKEEQRTENREQRTENREQGTGNREQGTGNREQGTENREQRTENREQRTENREQRTENREQRTENREQRTENREQRTENREQRTENRE